MKDKMVIRDDGSSLKEYFNSCASWYAKQLCEAVDYLIKQGDDAKDFVIFYTYKINKKDVKTIAKYFGIECYAIDDQLTKEYDLMYIIKRDLVSSYGLPEIVLEEKSSNLLSWFKKYF